MLFTKFNLYFYDVNNIIVHLLNTISQYILDVNIFNTTIACLN